MNLRRLWATIGGTDMTEEICEDGATLEAEPDFVGSTFDPAANMAASVVNHLKHWMKFPGSTGEFLAVLKDKIGHEALESPDETPENVFGRICARYSLNVGSAETATEIMKSLEIYPPLRVHQVAPT